MPPNRLISLPGGGTLLQVHALQDGVLAVFLLDAQHGLLEFFLPGVGSVLFSPLLLLCRRQGRFALCLMPMAGLFISILFSAGVFVRYAYPLMACAPVLLALSLARPAPEDVA